jgi:hypothetical protein
VGAGVSGPPVSLCRPSLISIGAGASFAFVCEKHGWIRASSDEPFSVTGGTDTPFRLIVAAEIVAIGGLGDYYFFFRSRESIRERLRGTAEASWLTAAMGALAILHFGAVLLFIAMPVALAWSVFPVAGPMR